LCGVGEKRLPPNPEEAKSLRSLRRGAFARRLILAGEAIRNEDIYFAFPPDDGQYTASDWSKYAVLNATANIPVDAAITPVNASIEDRRARVWDTAQRVKAMLAEYNIVVPGSADLEISHHYGLDRFDDTGLVLITVVNRGYCKKLLVTLPGQSHPEQYHMKKEETFHVLAGEVHLALDGVTRICRPGDVITIEPSVRHSFHSPNGSVIEEISSTHFKDDSFYTDESINQNKDRKTLLTYWMG
jgi:quercetin dioxygenase-like cupin family protein